MIMGGHLDKKINGEFVGSRTKGERPAEHMKVEGTNVKHPA
jgi:hypothetical protein